MAKALSLSREQFIADATLVHGGRYDFSEAEYVNSTTKVKVLCPDHGPFYIRPLNLKDGKGCSACGRIATTEKQRHSGEEFIKAAASLYDGRYSYEKTKYINGTTKVLITCPEHGDFLQIPADHLSGHACVECGRDKIKDVNRMTQEEFVERSKEIHGDKYSYDKADYLNSRTPVTIVCRDHGEFQRDPASHWAGYGCQICSSSLLEQGFSEFLETLGVPFIQKDRSGVAGRSAAGKLLELDFYFPEKKLAVELNGLYWHSTLSPGKDDQWARRHMKEKAESCASRGVRLVHYYEDEWLHARSKVEAQMRSLLGLEADTRFARNLELAEVGWAEAATLYDEVHLQGRPPVARTHFGLKDKGVLISVMSFSPITSHRGVKAANDDVELVRFASRCRVVGGASKLFAGFLRGNPEVARVVSYSDNRWSSGGVYQVLGFSKDRSVPVDYYYVDKAARLRIHKSQFRRSALAKKFPDQFDPSLTEKQNCELLGIPRIYNCGLTKWVWEHPTT
jgi:hypothetical protein